MSEQDLKERSSNAETIIRNHMLWSMGAGLIPIPVADFIAVGAIQLAMVKQLCQLYELPFKESEGKAIITALTGTGLAKVGARVAVKFIPGIGSVIGGVTMSVLSGASTYALGEAFKKHFETGGTILDFDLKRLKKVYDEKFEKGKEMAREMKVAQEKATKPNAPGGQEGKDKIEKLKELVKLKEDGVINEAEFEQIKKDIISE